MATIVLASPALRAEPISACPVQTGIHRYIRTELDLFHFQLPRFAKVKKIQDIDYRETRVQFEKYWMRLMTGIHSGAPAPREIDDPAIRWTSTQSECADKLRLTDFIGNGTDGRRWRHVSFAFGFASYSGVSPEAAAYFDKILNRRCCGKGLVVEH